MAAEATSIISHWHNLLEGYQESPQNVYSLIEQAIEKRELPDTKVSRITMHEKGMLSAKREYLRIQSKKHLFDICAAPYGSGFFVSWWLGSLPGGCLTSIPIIGPIISVISPEETYFTYDTALMFRDSVHSAVIEVIDHITKEKGIRALTEAERKPILSELFRK